MSKVLERPAIICLTPVKNESWILERFLQGASLWADKIILADQGSTDQTRSIAERFEKVALVGNDDEAYSEDSRQKLLLREARRIPGPKLLVTLDADEFLSNTDLTSPEWQTMLTARPGTVFRFRWIHVNPDLTFGKRVNMEFPWGFLDDGTEHTGRSIHSPRVPLPEIGRSISLNDIAVFHYGFVLPERDKSKKRWYRAWAAINTRRLRSVEINRQYLLDGHPDYNFVLPSHWIGQYRARGIDMTSFEKEVAFTETQDRGLKSWRQFEIYWWDREVLAWLERYGSDYFRKYDIWDQDWVGVAGVLRHPDPRRFRDPRSLVDRLVQRWTRKTYLQSRGIVNGGADQILKVLGY